MPTPRSAPRSPRQPHRPPRPSAGSSPTGQSGLTGRHRRRPSPGRSFLLSAFAVLTLLLGSGTAISLTAAGPTPPPRTGPDVAALGDAPTSQPPDRSARRGALGATPPAVSPTAAPEAPAEAAAADSDGASDELAALEDEVTRLTNEQRKANRCAEVRTDERLRTAARGHSEDMAVNDYFDHDGLDGRDPFDRMRDAGYPDPAGENIAYGYRTPADVVNGWMNSDGHRRNILTCSHQATGVGLVYDADGRPYWTQVFGS